MFTVSRKQFRKKSSVSIKRNTPSSRLTSGDDAEPSGQRTPPALASARRANLLVAIERMSVAALESGADSHGLQADFAQRAGISRSMLSQLKTHRTMGDRLARQIEANLGWESGTLDAKPSEATRPKASAQLKAERLVSEIFSRGTSAQKRAAVTALLAIAAPGGLGPPVE